MKSIFSFLKGEDSRKRYEEKYLNGAKSLSELEHRMRQVDRGLFQNTPRHF